MASSVALLALQGRPWLGVQVLCGGTACRTETFLDNDGKPVVRFIAPGPGRLVIRVHNGGAESGVLLKLERELVCPRGTGNGPAVVTDAILLTHGTSYDVSRDDSTGCSMFLRPLRDHRDRPVLEREAGASTARSRWRLHVQPRLPAPGGAAAPVSLAAGVWSHRLLLEGEVPLAVTTPAECRIIEVEPTAAVSLVKRKIEESLGIPFDLQAVTASDGSEPSDQTLAAELSPEVRRLFTVVYVCSRECPSGPVVWFHVQQPEIMQPARPLFLVANSTDTAASVWDRVSRRLCLGLQEDMYELHQDGAPIDLSRTLEDLGVVCMSTLTVAERGHLKVTVRLAEPAPPVAVSVRVNLSDLGREVRHRLNAKLKVLARKESQLEGVLRRLHLFGLYLEDGHRLQEELSISECGVSAQQLTVTLRHCGNLQVPVRTDAGCLLVWTDLDNPVIDVFKKVHDLLRVDERGSQGFQLKLAGVPLDFETSLRQAGVDASAVLTHEKQDGKPLSLIVKTPEGTCRWVSCWPSDTVEDFTEMIAQLFELPPENLEVMGGQRRRVLESGHTLADYGVQDTSMIIVRYKLLGGGCDHCWQEPCICMLALEVEDGSLPTEALGDEEVDPGLTVGEVVPGPRAEPPPAKVVRFPCDQERGNSNFEFEIFIDEERWRKIYRGPTRPMT